MKPFPADSRIDLVDEARHDLCSQFAQAVRGGTWQVRVRLDSSSGAAWFYEHYDNQWHKRDAAVQDPQLVAAIAEQLDDLASKPHGDAFQVSRRMAADWRDTDISFHREKIESHVNESLEAYLLGLLFLDHRDAGQDVRRRIRGGLHKSRQG